MFSQIAGLTLERKASWSLGEPNSSLGSHRALWRPLGGGHSPWTYPHFPRAAQSPFLQISQFPGCRPGTHGRQVALKKSGATVLVRKRASKSMASERLSCRPAPHGFSTAWRRPGPHSNKGRPGKAKAWGGAAGWEGRAPLGAAAASSPSPSRGLSHGPPPRVGEMGAEVWTPGFSRATGKELGEGAPIRESGEPGVAAGKGVREPSPTRGRRERGPAPFPGPARAPFPLLIVLRQSGRGPRQAPRSRSRSPSLLLQGSLFSPSSLLSPDLPRSLSPPLPLLSGPQAPAHPSPRNPSACKLPEGLPDLGKAVSPLSLPRSRPCPRPWAVSPLCRDCLSVRSQAGWAWLAMSGFHESGDPRTGLSDSGEKRRGAGPPYARVPGTAGVGGRRWRRDGVGVDARVLGTGWQPRHPGSESPRGRVFPPTRFGAECGAEGWGLGGGRGVFRAELEGDRTSGARAEERQAATAELPSLGPLLLPLPLSSPLSVRSSPPDTHSGPTARSPAGFPAVSSHSHRPWGEAGATSPESCLPHPQPLFCLLPHANFSFRPFFSHPWDCL